ncbi:TIGR03862 family flavoprotein [Rhodocyclus tenuis]|uniref:TIGR03862 family flavoprotein n=1 Tax=Rhodocyclus gracilis TaxID=2929842 RepID=UPI001298A705|nr:TIGR03862 family flavoprotein [Rhodocyclus gracilis]MRD71859.1 TIGR03862 family flavoprotein [Rhodocyclus gracilis]
MPGIVSPTPPAHPSAHPSASAPVIKTGHIAVIGGGPAGLMAAETLALAGYGVDLYDALPSVGRKLLIAGKGGLNITHAENELDFRRRYGARQAEIAPLLDAFGPTALRDWMHALGIDSFVGSSGRVFPVGMKAAPLLRAWLRRLRAAGVQLHMRHRCLGLVRDSADNTVAPRWRLATPEGECVIEPTATVLALGGGSWPMLGADGRWVEWLRAAGIPVASLLPANCGFERPWSDFFRERFAGEPLKNVAVRVGAASPIEAAATKDTPPAGPPASSREATRGDNWRRGEFIVTTHGVEGGLIYAHAAALRDTIAAVGHTTLWLDLLPDRTAAEVRAEVAHPRGRRSLGSHLASRLGLKGVKAALLRECANSEELADPERLAAAIKCLPLTLHSPRPLAEAISSAGGVLFSALDEHLMLRALPGIFCAGEMLDWEAPTGGYLLTACFASGRVAGSGAARWLAGAPALPRNTP